MKMLKLLPLVVFVVAISACQKEPVTKPVKFTSTTYETLGTYDTSGRPNYLTTPDSISPDELEYLRNTLPEKSDVGKSHPELLSSSAIADIAITEPSDVSITFVAQGSGYSNAFAFYTYPTNNPPRSAKDIKTITYIFPNAGRDTKLKPGDKVKIGRFNAGTSIGFVLIRGGWNRTTKTLNNEGTHYCSNDVLNPEVDPKLKKHAILIKDPSQNRTLIGFEDLDRTDPTCDNDFNDVVTYATVTH